MIEDQIIQQILHTWSLDQDHPHKGRQKKPIPSFKHVKEIIEKTFLASLKREEERSIRFGIVLAKSNEIERGELHSSESILHLKAKLQFTVETISKIAPALDPNRCSIAVGPTENDGELEIWGIFTFAPNEHRFNEIPVAISGQVSFRPDFFTVHAKSPGSILIARSNSQIGRFVNGSFTPALPTPFTSHSLGGYLIESIKKHDLWDGFGNEYWLFFRDALEVLLAEAAARGHGSTIVLLNRQNIEYCSSFFKPRYQFSENLGVKSLFEISLPRNDSIFTGIAHRKLILERLELIAQLGAIDGALILSNKLDCIAIGATLAAPPWLGEIVTGPDGFGRNSGEKFDNKKLGFRHNSAIDFAGACPGSVVFVISQDGPVRAFRQRDPKTVLCWPDCSVSMFL